MTVTLGFGAFIFKSFTLIESISSILVAVEYINEIKGEFELYLKTFLHLTEEDIADLSSMNSSAIVVLVSERLNNEE